MRSAPTRLPGPSPPQPGLTCSCGMGDLRACPPRKARACNLRQEERGGFSLEGSEPREKQLGFGQGECPTKLSSIESLTQIEDSELRELRHHQRPQAACTAHGGGAFSRAIEVLYLPATAAAVITPGCGGQPGDHARAPSDGGGGKDYSKCQNDRAQVSKFLLSLLLYFTQPPQIMLNWRRQEKEYLSSGIRLSFILPTNT